jgi:mono/diheme cytochrome c family protein
LKDARRNALKKKQILAGCIGVLFLGVMGPSAASIVAQAPAVPRPQAAGSTPAPSASSLAAQRAVLDQYCNACHNLRARAAKLDSAVRLAFDDLDLNKVGEHPEIWEKVVRKVRAGLMPPTNSRRPDAATLNGLAAWLENELDRKAETHLPAPGLHRLNRAEYTNAIRDILGLEVDATKFLPADDSSHGFDNMAGSLTMSPALMEAYLSAAGKISRLAMGSETEARQVVFDVPPDTAQNHRIEGLPFGTRGGMLIKYEFPADGEYSFTVKGITGYFTRVLGQITKEKLELTVDGERVYLFDWDSEIANKEGEGGSSPAFPIRGGLHTIGVTFLATNDLPGTELNRPFERTVNSPGEIPGFMFYPHVGQVFINGPFHGSPSSDTPARRKIFTCQPQREQQETTCARQIVSTLAKKAFRRPVKESDLETLMNFYTVGRNESKSFDGGIQAAIQRILVDPEFLYRSEIEPSPSTQSAANPAYTISQGELASRLSFFLWSSIPDDELINLAAQNRLREPATLERQVRRMLADPRAKAFVKNFTGQWLNVRSMDAKEPVIDLFPDFDDNLRAAFREEIELFFGSVMQEDRSVLDLLDADYTFANERLAKHYGIPNVYGPQFRRVTLPAGLDMRRGLLGKGALLTITSQAARTSPVARGKWFLETFLGVSPPDPPPGVESNLDKKKNEAPKTLRERMEAHRSNPVCASCHQIFEPMGMALENFDAVGKWRTYDEGALIDPTGVTTDGSKLDGVKSLRELTKRYSDQFAVVVTEKLLTYAVGRGMEDRDMPMVRTISRASKAKNYRFSSLVMGVIESKAFQMNTKSSAVGTQRAGR